MKKFVIVLILSLFSRTGFSQMQEIQQLILNVEKLAQFKAILQDMYDGYTILSKGYTAIRDISSGNFNLHKGFLDALMEVSPAVKKYKRIADIVNYQILIVKQYKAAFNKFKGDNSFSLQELDYIGKVYGNLFNESVKNLDELAMVITAGKLRMSDDERLQAIDRIYSKIEDQYSFLQDFNSSTSYLSLQRKMEQADVNMSRKLRGF
ncbi:MAG: TerB family tellurite resistance protein [Chitinophagaceae bacterium]